jgi:hypothetical protein
MSLLIRSLGEGKWRAPTTQSYTDEEELQVLLEQSPVLIPGVDPDRCVVAREVHLGDGYADLVVVDADGVITIVECKLRANPETRRSVVGQLFAYAAGLWRLSYDDFDAAMSARHANLSDLAQQSYATDDPEFSSSSVRGSIARSLASGRFRLVIAVDHITGELRSIIEYLNTQTVGDVQVLGLELEYVADEGVEILIPNLYGQETAVRKPGPRGSTHTWTKEELFEVINVMTEPLRSGFAHIFQHAQTHPQFDHWYWGDGRAPSVTPWMTSPGGYTQPWTIFVDEAGKEVLAINFDWIHRRGAGFPNEAVRRFADRIRVLPGTAALVDQAQNSGWRKRPSFQARSLFSQPDSTAQIVTALDELYADPAS